TNRVLARFVDKAAVSFADALPYFRGKGVLTGNPVRQEFFAIPPKPRDASKYSLLIFGGSQGARAINEAMIAALTELTNEKNLIHIVHQTGEAEFEKVKQGYGEVSWSHHADVRRYIDDMVNEFSRADLVICRAGATTTAELVAAGKAAIMIPFPLAADDHQRKNAEALENGGAARMILQKDLSGERLASGILALVNEPQRIAGMQSAGRKLARPDAAAATVDLMEQLASRKQKAEGRKQ